LLKLIPRHITALDFEKKLVMADQQIDMAKWRGKAYCIGWAINAAAAAAAAGRSNLQLHLPMHAWASCFACVAVMSK